MKHFNYPVDIITAEDGVTIIFPDIPECITEGDSEDEALHYAVDALETALFGFYVDEDKDLPQPSKAKKNQKTVAPSLQCSLKLHLYEGLREKSMTVANLASAMNSPWHNTKRLLDEKYVAKLERYEDALKCVGIKCTISR